MPFLNCIEKANQETLCKVLPKLHQDLSNIRMDTLEKYHVEWKHVNTKANAPSSKLDRYLLSVMCKYVAIRVKLQCSREYWDDKMGSTRATQIHISSAEERKYLPTNNLNCEIYLAKFGVLASESANDQTDFLKQSVLRMI